MRYHTAEEIRRYDLMKLGVLLLLLLLLALTWYATRNDQTPELVGEVPTAPAEGESVLPAPTLGIPSINPPTEALAPGSVTLSGTAGSGAQIVVLVNGQPSGAAITGVDGAWSAALDLPAGQHTVQAQTVDNVGSVVGVSQPIIIHVGDVGDVGGSDETAPQGLLNPPDFDPTTGDYTFTGSAAPGETVTITVNGVAVGTTTADETGNFVLVVPAEVVTGGVIIQSVDATGIVTGESEELKLSARPPSLDLPGDLILDPAGGSIVVPEAGEGITLTGRGEPGTQVEALINGQQAGLAVVDVDGAWTLPLALPDGTLSLQLNTLDPSGGLLSSATPIDVIVGTPPAGATPVSGAPTPGVAFATLNDLLAARPEFSTLLALLQSTGRTETLAQPGPFTVFAPTNEAFAQLPQQVIDGLNANPQVLTEVMQYHITQGRYPAADLTVVQPATVNGRLLTVTPQGDSILVNDALVTTTDLTADNGLVHAIDRILVPPLAEGVRPPVIDSSGVATFVGTFLTIVGTGEPNQSILVELNGEPFGQPAIVDANGNWQASGDVTPGDYQIVAYMLDAAGALSAIARPVTLLVR